MKSFKKIYKWYYSIINYSDKKEKKIVLVLNNSKFIRFLLGLYKKSKFRIIDFSKRNRVIKIVKGTMEDFYAMPLRTAGIIVTIAILTNTLLSVLLKRPIGFLGWIMKIILLFVSFVSMFYNVNKQKVK